MSSRASKVSPSVLHVLAVQHCEHDNLYQCASCRDSTREDGKNGLSVQSRVRIRFVPASGRKIKLDKNLVDGGLQRADLKTCINCSDLVFYHL